MRFDAVIFDLDGTLVDTIPLWARAYMDTFADFDIEISKEDFMENIYVQSMSLMDALELRSLSTDLEPSFRKKRDERYIKLLETEAQWISSAPDVLIELKNKLPIAIATGSHRTYTDALDRNLQLSSYSSHIFTCDDVENDKPAPDMLLLAAKELDMSPKKCLYVGDQLFDVEAAKAANMTCWLVPNTDTPMRAFQEADAVLQNLSEILEKL